MVRPIEITDALSKAQQVGRMVQNVLARPEAEQESEKAQNEKRQAQRTHAPDPVQEADQVVLHIDEDERGKRQTAEDRARKRRRKARGNPGDEDGNAPPDGHIDITA